MIWVTDHKGNCTYLSPEWYDLTGQKLDEALGAGWTEAIHPDDRVAIVDGFAQACARQVEFMLRYRLRRGDGSYIWILDAASPSFTPLTHEFVGFLGLISRYKDDEAQDLTAKAEIGTFRPGRAQGEFAPRNKLDIAADYLIAARAVTVEYGDEVAAAIDNALYALAQALRRDRSEKGSADTHH
ncbi:PAS domain-containing protein [Methylorubrum populi]|uniref:histidine kinase n=1 Tax=Methylorubrum populi TaxID=223967 RepID=A0A160PHU5_9HYPH|nr:PAS domain-containing protein [Methylorubrum populi]BAU92454.1 PAS domain-containing protein [Methylorubrum populi]